MIKHLHCDVFETYAAIIAHQVNCMGVMGSGVASQVKSRFPEAYKSYRCICDTHSHCRDVLLGQVQFCPVSFNPDGTPRIYIANMFGQLNYGRSPYTVYTDYAALRKCLSSLADFARKNNLIIAIPYKIGCVRGNGDWDGVVYPMIQSILGNNEVLLCDNVRF